MNKRDIISKESFSTKHVQLSLERWGKVKVDCPLICGFVIADGNKEVLF